MQITLFGRRLGGNVCCHLMRLSSVCGFMFGMWVRRQCLLSFDAVATTLAHTLHMEGAYIIMLGICYNILNLYSIRRALGMVI